MYTENPNRKVICVDVDHTLTADLPGQYSPDPTPYMPVIYQVKRLHRTGHIIIIWTARQWGDAPNLVSWLVKHQIPYHGIMMGKGGADIYLDDKMISIDQFIREGV